MSERDGGPAFPTDSENFAPKWAGAGMTLRDYFAAKAVQGLLASGPSLASGATAGDIFEAVALDAFQFADAMLKARAQPAPTTGEG